MYIHGWFVANVDNKKLVEKMSTGKRRTSSVCANTAQHNHTQNIRRARTRVHVLQVVRWHRTSCSNSALPAATAWCLGLFRLRPSRPTRGVPPALGLRFAHGQRRCGCHSIVGTMPMVVVVTAVVRSCLVTLGFPSGGSCCARLRLSCANTLWTECMSCATTRRSQS